MNMLITVSTSDTIKKHCKKDFWYIQTQVFIITDWHNVCILGNGSWMAFIQIDALCDEIVRSCHWIPRKGKYVNFWNNFLLNIVVISIHNLVSISFNNVKNMCYCCGRIIPWLMFFVSVCFKLLIKHLRGFTFPRVDCLNFCEINRSRKGDSLLIFLHNGVFFGNLLRELPLYNLTLGWWADGKYPENWYWSSISSNLCLQERSLWRYSSTNPKGCGWT